MEPIAQLNCGWCGRTLAEVRPVNGVVLTRPLVETMEATWQAWCPSCRSVAFLAVVPTEEGLLAGLIDV